MTLADRQHGRAPRPGSVQQFGAFELDGPLRRLTRQCILVRIGGRALDVLLALVERPGELLGKDELLAKVWPGVHADEASLRVQVASLRRILGHGEDAAPYIRTVPGRGYRFFAPVAGGLDQARSSRAWTAGTRRRCCWHAAGSRCGPEATRPRPQPGPTSARR